jgi:hypothetical protein
VKGREGAPEVIFKLRCFAPPSRGFTFFKKVGAGGGGALKSLLIERKEKGSKPLGDRGMKPLTLIAYGIMWWPTARR